MTPTQKHQNNEHELKHLPKPIPHNPPTKNELSQHICFEMIYKTPPCDSNRNHKTPFLAGKFVF